MASAMPGTKRREPPGRSVAPRRASSTMPATISPAPSTTWVGTPSALQERHRREREDQDGEDRAAAARPDPEREVEKDSGAAREREQREDEAYERRVDAERVRDAAADTGDDAVALASLEGEDRDLRHGTRTTSMWPAPTCASMRITPLPGVDLCVPSVVVDAEGVDVAGLDVRGQRHLGVARDVDLEPAHADMRLHLDGLTCRQVGQVDASASRCRARSWAARRRSRPVSPSCPRPRRGG